MNNYFKFEPVLTLAALQGLAAAALAVVVLATPISAPMIAAIGVLIEAVFIVAATFVRGAVTPTASLNKLRDLTPEQVNALGRGELG